MQDVRVPSLPSAVYLAAYDVYCHLYGQQPAMVDIKNGCRGGFTPHELIAFLYARSLTRAEWGSRFDEAMRRR